MTSMHIGRVVAALTIGAALATAPALAQRATGGGMGMPRYDKATETTVTGVVEEVQSHQGRRGGTGVHLAFKTESGVVDVHVGPVRWLADREFAFVAGDALEIVGSKMMLAGKEAILARQITKGRQTMTLRSENGIPRWSRRGAGTD